MNIDENKILEYANDLKNGKGTMSEMKELLGGERLNDIFDDSTVNALMKNIIDNGKIHNMLNENGLDILEGLLNNQVKGDLSNFYMIKSEYVIQLPQEERKNMAESISGGREDLSQTLQTLWDKGIKTEACTTKEEHGIPMVQLSVKTNETQQQDFIQQIYNQKGIAGEGMYIYENDSFNINLYGNNLYEIIVNNKLYNIEEKDNIFQNIMKESLEFSEEIYDSYRKSGIDTAEIEIKIEAEKSILMQLENNKKVVNNSANERGKNEFKYNSEVEENKSVLRNKTEEMEFKEGLQNRIYTPEEIAQKDLEVIQQSIQEQSMQQPVEQMPVAEDMSI